MCSFTGLRQSSLVPAGFLTAQFLQKLEIYKAFVVMGELGSDSGLACLAGKGKCREAWKDGLVQAFPFLQASNAK